MNETWLTRMDNDGQTPLDRAMACGHRSIAEMMLRQDRADQDSLLAGSPMHRAAYFGLADAIRSLLRYGTDATQRDEHGETPLHKAVRQGHRDAVMALVDSCDVNALSDEGLTPLHWACINGEDEIVELLVRSGADPNMSGNATDGLSATRIAKAMGYSGVARVFAEQAGAL